MGFKLWLLLGSLIAVVAIVGTGVHLLRQAAAETESRQQAERSESDCESKVQSAIDLVTKRDSILGARIQVTGATNHYNRRLKQCLVDISTFEHQDTPVYVKTLVDTANNSAILWSFTEAGEGAGRVCYGSESKQLDCLDADMQWKTLMSE